MIELKNVCIRTRGTLTPVSLNNITLRIEAGQHVGLFVASKEGLAKLIEVICGANAPDSGSVLCNSRLSWPLPGAKFLHSHQNFIANARFIARLYEQDQSSFIDRVIEMADIADLAHEKISYCPKAARSRFTFALGACVPFEIYFFTSTSIGEKQDREKYAGIITELGRRNGLLLATTAGKSARPFCDQAYVIEERGAVYYDDIDAAVEHLERLTKKKKAEDSEELLSDQEQEETVSDDFF